MATKKKATKAKRPPRALWLVYPAATGDEGFTVGTKAAAEKNASSTDRIVGPYVLAERVRER